MAQPKYTRILLKLSGEALLGGEAFGIDPTVLNRVASEIAEVVSLGVQVAIVIGGGNLFRGSTLAQSGLNPTTAHHMGMLATVMNALALHDALKSQSIASRVMSAINMPSIAESFNRNHAQDLLEAGQVVIFSAGTGNPFFTTDSAASLRGIEIEADVILKATKVDGVFSADPLLDKTATMYKTISFNQVLTQELSVMDTAAICLCRDHHKPIVVFNMNKANALHKVIMGEDEGTRVE